MAEREDVEVFALREALMDWERNGQSGEFYGSPADLYAEAEHILASSWLAAHDEQVRAEERERLAGDLDALAAEVSPPSWLGAGEIAAKIRAVTERLAGEGA